MRKFYILSNMKRSLIPFITIPTIVIIDQIVKILVKTNMCLYDKIEITSWFYIYFTENKGMAFGMSFIGTMFLAIFRIIAIIAFICILYRIITNPKYTKGLIVAISAIIAGALGNLIDNILYGQIFTESLPSQFTNGQASQFVEIGNGYADVFSGKVVDMFYFPLFTWPQWMPLIGGDVFFGAVFNIADAAISLSFIFLILCSNKYLQTKS